MRILTCSIVISTLLALCPTVSLAEPFRDDIKPLLNKYCIECHSGDEPNGDVDFAKIETVKHAVAAFELWGKVDDLLTQKKMPPEDAEQPSTDEVNQFHAWYQKQFVESVEARPALFRPRRLSATEYRNTLRSLFGFDLEVAVMEAEQTISEKSLVMKLLPTDPPGKSRFRNDTYSNPLSTQIWEQYSYLTDFALEELFSDERRELLESMSGPISDEFTSANAATLIRDFVPRAWRRDLPAAELDAIVSNAVNGNSNQAQIISATKRELKTALMSPPFIYRGLLMRGEPTARTKVDAFELAERLSYFIWGDMPDRELLTLAKSGDLQKDGVLREQVERTLNSPKSTNLATDFATQWLSLDEIDSVSDNPPMMVALKSQPIDFFNYLITDNRPLTELIDSKTTFANPLTRKYYLPDTKQLGKYRKPSGIEIEIVPNKRITLEQTQGRGGLLTMPGVLAMNRGPILRGVWLLERIMGEHLPDPPADVGQVQASIPGKELSFRERFALHREKESCALCHDKIDPLGFALDEYDSKGGYLPAKDYKRSQRKRKANDGEATTVDASGQLPTGEEFANFAELKQVLVTTQREVIVRNIVKQMLAYALCRKLEIYDQPTVDQIVQKMMSTDGTWRDLIHAVVTSLPFRETIIPDA